MTIEQKIFLKLEPHAKRIQDGDGNDFDYLPAVLLQLMEEQKRQTKLLDETAKLLDFIKSTADTVGAQNKAQITGFEVAVHRNMEQVETAVKDAQFQIQKSQASITEQISLLCGAARKANEGLSAIDLQIKSLANVTQQYHVKFMRLLVVGLVGTTAMIGLAVAILQRH